GAGAPCFVLRLLLSSLLFSAFLPLSALAQTGASDLEEAEFSYGTGNFLDASVTTKSILASDSDKAIKERALVINLLSDMNLSLAVKAEAKEPGVSLPAKPELSGFFKALYERGRYEEMERLINAASGPEAAYLKALLLYKNGRYGEAEYTLPGIHASSRLFPYARLLLSEIIFAQNDVQSAISYLDIKDAAGGEISNTIKLYRGYLLFESGDFLGAEENFLKVDEKSSFSSKAVAGAAWSNLKRNDCKKALRLMDKMKPFDPSSEDSREMMLAEAYCVLETGNAREAEKLATEAIRSFSEIEAGYGRWNDTDALIKEKPVNLLKDASPYADAALKSLRNAAVARDSEAVALLLGQFKAIGKIKAAYDEKERGMDAEISSIERAVDARREALNEIKTRITKIKPLLKLISLKTLEKTSKGYEIKKPSPRESAEEPSIAATWEKTLNRKLSAEERRIIRMMLLDGEEGVWYMNNTKYADVLFWMAIDKTKDAIGTGRAEKGPLEHMAEDIFATAQNKALPVERILPLLEEASELRIKAEERVLADMRELKEQVSSDRQIIGNALKEININAAEILRKRVLMMTYDIMTVKKKAALLINDIRKESAGKRSRQ
ncbi:MAG: hypothetical protein WA162_02415, partial [Thermodesulfobacteriota bacterium]